MGAEVGCYVFEKGQYASIRDAYRAKYDQLRGYSDECEGYSGTIADCEGPKTVAGPRKGQTLRERIEELEDEVDKRASVGFMHEGCAVLVYCAPC